TAYTQSGYIEDLAVYPNNGEIHFSSVNGPAGTGDIKVLYWNSESGVWSSYVYLSFNLADVGGTWNGEFAFDRYGNLYIAQGSAGGNIYRYNSKTSSFSLYYDVAPSIMISSFCFDAESVIYYTSGNNQIFKLETPAQSLTDFTLDQQLDIAIIFVGYDQEFVDSAEILSRLPKCGRIYIGKYDDAFYDFYAKYSIHFASSDYQQSLDDLIAGNSYTANTSQLDMVALEYQATEWTPQDIFNPKNGTAIDGLAVEEWLAQNKYVLGADYSFYALNFSYLDSTNGEHWFQIPDIDADSGIDKHWFRNEFDFPWNFDASFPYPGYTGYKSTDTFFDPYCFQWYLNWRHVWNDLDIDDGDHEFYDEDLDHFLETRDLNSPAGKEAFNDYLADWMAELVPNYIFWDPLGRVDYVNDLSVQVKVFNGVHGLGYENSELDWAFNLSNFNLALSELLPGSSIDLDIDFLYLEDYPAIQNVLDDSELDYADYGEDPPIEDYTYYRAYNIFGTLFDDYYLNQFFDLDAAELVVKGYAFILDNASFASPGIWAGGGLFTGLGGGGQTLQLMELDRLYYPDRITPRQGFSKVLVHETGHGIGYPHPFTSSEFVSDFTADTMGYYGGFSRYSKVRIETFQQYAAEQEIYNASLLVQEHVLNDAEATWLEQLQNNWDYISGNYSKKEYVTARQEAINFQALIMNGYNGISSSSSTSTSTTSSISTAISESTPSIAGFHAVITVFVLTVIILRRKRRTS
ncbi:MAG: hypothetical protein ACTSRU_03615, partial [Candidatus Hodarchaeales archaeon]